MAAVAIAIAAQPWSSLQSPPPSSEFSLLPLTWLLVAITVDLLPSLLPLASFPAPPLAAPRGRHRRPASHPCCPRPSCSSGCLACRVPLLLVLDGAPHPPHSGRPRPPSHGIHPLLALFVVAILFFSDILLLIIAVVLHDKALPPCPRSASSPAPGPGMESRLTPHQWPGFNLARAPVRPIVRPRCTSQPAPGASAAVGAVSARARSPRNLIVVFKSIPSALLLALLCVLVPCRCGILLVLNRHPRLHRQPCSL